MMPLASLTTQNMHAGIQRVTLGIRHRASALPEMIKVDITKVPDWQRRAARLSIALLFFGMLGHCMRFPPEHQVFASNFRQSCNWAAITCIVVTAPVIGKVAQVAFDRLLGTAVGGFIGYISFTIGFHFFGVFGGGIFISAMSAVTVWSTSYLAFRFSLDQLVRFVQLTYCIVGFGAKPDKGAFLLALIRVGGIFAGGLLSVLLAVVVLPRSASVEALHEMKKALKVLHDLNQEVWALSGVATKPGGPGRRCFRRQHRHGYSALQLLMDKDGRGRPGAGVPVTVSDSSLSTVEQHGLRTRNLMDHSMEQLNMLVQRDDERDSHEAVIEKLFTSVYTTLARMDEHLANVKGEIYVWHFWGRYFFLPGVHWFPARGRWQVPKQDLEKMATCVRRVARMLWTLLLDFEEGFGAEMEEVLQLYYPKQLLSELANYQARAIMDLLRAFPGRTTIEVDNLFTLGQVTDCLLQISDARARTTFFSVKRKRNAAANLGRHRQNPMPPADRSTELTDPRPEHTGAHSSAAKNTTTPEELRELDPLLPPKATGTRSDEPNNNISMPSGAAGAASTAAGAINPGTIELRRRTASGLTRLRSAGPSGGEGADGDNNTGGGGVFRSRLLSTRPDSPATLPLPPRRYLRELQDVSLKAAVAGVNGAVAGAGEAEVPQVLRTLSAAEGISPEFLAAARGGSIDVLGDTSFSNWTPETLAAAVGLVPAATAAPAASTLAERETVTAPAVGRERQHSAFEVWGKSSRGPSVKAPSGYTANGYVGVTSPTVPLHGLAAAAALPCSPAFPSEQSERLLGPQGPAALVGSRLVPADGSVRNTQQPVQPDEMQVRERELQRAVGGDRSGVDAGESSAATAGVAAAAATPFMPFAKMSRPDGASASAVKDAASYGPASTTGTSTGAIGAQDMGRPAIANSTAAAAMATILGATLGGQSSLDGTGSMASYFSSLLVEPVTFPPTEEGYLSQVRWYSFQFVMDEMVNELEEAFQACSAVLQQLPYPVGA